MADVSIVLPIVNQDHSADTVRTRTSSWYPVNPDDRTVRDIGVDPMFDGLVLCHPLGSGRAFVPYLAVAFMIEPR